MSRWMMIAYMLAMAGCSGFATEYKVTLENSDASYIIQDRVKAKAIAQRIARAYNLLPTGTPTQWKGTILQEGETLLAQYSSPQNQDTVQFDGRDIFVRLSLTASVSESVDGSALYFFLIDFSNASETEYVRSVREDLKHQLGDSFGAGRVVLEFRGKAGSQFFAP